MEKFKSLDIVTFWLESYSKPKHIICSHLDLRQLRQDFENRCVNLVSEIVWMQIELPIIRELRLITFRD